jgi:chromosomal replication initiation ATPase DnaA
MTPMSKTVLSLWKGELPRCLTRLQIAEGVCERHGLSIKELRSDSKADRVAHPRQEAMVEMYEAGHIQNDIARFFNRNHATVNHARKVVPARLARLEPGV